MIFSGEEKNKKKIYKAPVKAGALSFIGVVSVLFDKCGKLFAWGKKMFEVKVKK